MGAPLDTVAAVLRAALAQSGRVIRIRDRASGRERTAGLDTAVASAGLLPLFLAAGEAVWRDATGGRGFGLRLEADAASIFGYRVTSPGTAPLPVIVLATMEAIEQVATPGVVPVNALNDLCRAASARMAPVPEPQAVQGPGTAP